MTGPAAAATEPHRRQAPASASFLGELRLGRFRWELIHPFPDQHRGDRAVGDAAVTELRTLLAGEVDPDELDRTRTMPPDLVAALAAKDFLRMAVPGEDGGRALSPFNVFRLIEAASSRSGAVGLLLAVHNALSVAAYLPVLTPGPLRKMIVDRLAEGTVCGVADTEPAGAANTRRSTVAVPATDGRGYLLTGEKTFIGNGRIAGLLAVSATVADGDGERIDLFVVDTASEGFTVMDGHDFMGLNGAPSAALRLDRVYVPKEHVLVATDGGWRASPLVAGINALARMHITVAPAAAVARNCLRWSREFLSRRRVNGRPLGDYDAVRRQLDTSLAEVFALDSVVRWCLLGEDGDARGPERTSAKNIGTTLAWRVVDRTMSLLGAEGFETASSKARRGVPALPVERGFRDARGLRIVGGVDFNIDIRGAQHGIFDAYYAGAVDSGRLAQQGRIPVDLGGARLSRANRATVDYLRDQVTAFAARCLDLARGQPAEALFERQVVLIAANRLADELFTMSAVLARAAALAAGGMVEAQWLAEVYCANARRRIAGWWRELDAADERGHEDLSRRWLAGELAEVLAG
jgi:alkylation response protein AidB-like acyl-CoA dehydrogenase